MPAIGRDAVPHKLDRPFVCESPALVLERFFAYDPIR